MATIHVIKYEQPDDIIKINRLAEDEYKVEFTPGDLKKIKYNLFLTLDQVKQYTENLFHLLESEYVNPFDEIQLTSRAFPAVLYNISDLRDPKIRGILYNTLDFSLENEIYVVKKEQKQ